MYFNNDEDLEKSEIVKYVASERFKTKDGKPIEWKLTGKIGTLLRKVARNATLGELVAGCIIFPDLNNAELQNEYGVKGADQLLKRMLLPGEYANLSDKIEEIYGGELLGALFPNLSALT